MNKINYRIYGYDNKDTSFIYCSDIKSSHYLSNKELEKMLSAVYVKTIYDASRKRYERHYKTKVYYFVVYLIRKD